MHAFFRGFLRYTDIFDTRYILGFCFVFDKKGSRWVLMGGKDHNYCRKEKNGPEIPDWMHPSEDTASIRSALNSASLQVDGKPATENRSH
jgi:hypothetical protein